MGFMFGASSILLWWNLRTYRKEENENHTYMSLATVISALSDAVADLVARVTATVEANTNAIESLQGVITDLSAQVQSLSEDDTADEAAIAALTASLDAANAELTVLRENQVSEDALVALQDAVDKIEALDEVLPVEEPPVVDPPAGDQPVEDGA